jgi:hypothetical protein
LEVNVKFNRFFTLALLAAVPLSTVVACGDDEDEGPERGKIGGSCDPDASDSCEGSLECTPRGDGNVCTYPAGTACNPDNDDLPNGGCSESAECVAPEPAIGAGGGGGSDGGEPTCLIKKGEECDPESGFCSNGLTCAELENGEHRCFGAIVFRGQVTDTSDGAAIEDAQVMAIDDQGVAVSDVVLSNAEGNYELEVPAVRNEDGTPVDGDFTLRGAAQDYQPFPSGIRVALPIDVTETTADGELYVIDNALTDIGLIPLEAGERSMISGQVAALEGDAAGEVGGVLVVATDPDGNSFSAVTDKSGNYTIFNVPAGEYEIKAYAADLQVESGSATVGDEPVQDVDLAQLEADTATVSGNIQLVNPGDGSVTSVILVVADTFDPDVARGEVPRGLRAPRTGAPDVSGAFEIEGVPVGSYVVLAAYENDDLVRDPDTNIGGTGFVTVDVEEGDTTIDLSESFKVTGALGITSPGAEGPEAVTEKPVLEWADDSSEDWYDVRVFDAFGNEVWTSLMLPGVSGMDTVTLQYEGPLDPGMYYQFRVTSWRQPGGGDAAPISSTEDLRGVFYNPAN